MAEHKTDATDPLVGTLVSDRYRVLRKLGFKATGKVAERHSAGRGGAAACALYREANIARETELAELLQQAGSMQHWDPRDHRMEHVFTVDLRGVELYGVPKEAVQPKAFRSALAPFEDAGTISSISNSPYNRTTTIIGSTQLSQTLTGAQFPRMTGSWFKNCRQIIDECGGHMSKYLGDGFFCYWEGGADSHIRVRQAIAKLREAQTTSTLPFRVVLHHGSTVLGSVPTMSELCNAPDPLALARGEDVAAQALAFADERIKNEPVLIYATATPDEVKAVQKELGVAKAGHLVEQALASIAAGLKQRGVRQFVVAGGETSGAVVQALDVRALRIGPQIDPGVPWCHAHGDAGPLHITLKSGNFGTDDFFSKAFTVLT